MSRLALLGAVIGVLWASQAAAQEVMPRWTFSGRGLLSFDMAQEGGADLDPEWTFWSPSDTNLNVRVDQVLFSDAIGGFAVGVRLNDPDSPLAPAYLYQVAAELQGRYLMVRLGRHRRPTVGLDFPTLRDEDLLTARYPLNPFSVGGLEEDVLFSDQLVVTWRPDFRWHLQASAEALRDTVESGDAALAGPPVPNAAGLRLFYEELPGELKLARVTFASLGLFAQFPGSELPDEDPIWQLRGAVSVNLNADPIHLLDLRLEGVYQGGPQIGSPTTLNDTWRAASGGGSAALRYLWSPEQFVRLQAAVSGGYRRQLEAELGEWRVLPTLFYRLGINVDVGVQYAFSHYDRDLAGVLGVVEEEHALQLAFVYNFDVRLNDTFGEPRTILNAEYEYIPVN